MKIYSNTRNIIYNIILLPYIILLVLALAPQQTILSEKSSIIQEDVYGPLISSNRGWLIGWEYRKSHKMIGSPGAENNYTIKINVHRTTGTDDGENVYISNKSKLDFGDIRFTGKDGRIPLNYWIEKKMDGVNATIWVKIGSNLSQNQSFYVYYGNKEASGTSNGLATFVDFPGDFERNMQIRQYATVAEDSFVRNFNGWRTPEATFFDTRFGILHFSKRFDRTYIVYANVDSDAMITYYDHKTDSFASPINIGNSSPPNDAHANPRLTIDSEGYLYVFWGSHNSNQKMRRSSYSENITAWEHAKEIPGQFTYPQVFFIDKTMYWFYRTHWYSGQWAYSTSTDYMTNWTWGPENIVIAEPGGHIPYPIFMREGESRIPIIHVAWIVYDNVYNNEKWRDIYYAYSNDGGITWKKRDGTILNLPLNENNADLVYDYNYTHGWVDDLQLNPSQDPIILFLEGNNGSVENIVKIAKYENNSWILRTVTDTPISRYNLPSMRIEDNGTIKVYIPIGGDPNGNSPGYYGGEIQEFVSADNGNSWKKTKDITYQSPFLHDHIMVARESSTYRPVYNEQLQLVWSYGLDEPGKVFAWGPKLKKRTYHIYNNIEETPAWWAYNNYSILKVEPEGYYGQGAIFKQTSANRSGYAYHNTHTISTNNSLAFEIRTNIKSDPSETFYYITLQDINRLENYGPQIAFLNDSTISYRDQNNLWHPLKNYSNDIWYHIKIYNINMTEHTFNIAIDGLHLEENYSFAEPADELSRIRIGSGPQSPNTMAMSDNYFVRKFIDPEPYNGPWGHEERYGAPSLSYP